MLDSERVWPRHGGGHAHAALGRRGQAYTPCLSFRAPASYPEPSWTFVRAEGCPVPM